MDNNKLKTIEDLNNKWWYRLLKVVIVLLVLYGFLAVFVVSYDEYHPRQVVKEPKSYVHCEKYDTNLSLTRIEEMDSYYISFWPSNGKLDLEDDKKEDIRDLCDGDFSLEVNTQNRGSWFKLVGASIVGLVAVLLAFELLRRVFYYVILGSFIPPKNKK
ncbi:MAG: hypothetical protein ABEJ24_03930 [Candidatus Magasanikbacteria bacterium]